MRYVNILLLSLLYMPSTFAACFLTDVECIASWYLPEYEAGATVREWTAYSGRTFAEGNLIITRVRFDDEAIDILQDGDFGIEIEIVLKGPNRNIELDRMESTFPLNSRPGRDTQVLDYVTNYGSNTVVHAVHVLKPKELEAEVDYYVFFRFKEDLSESGVVVLSNLQITLDIDYDYWTGLGHFLIEGIPWLDQFQYYILETDSHEEFTAYPTGGAGVCWESKTSSYNCDPPPGACFVSNERDLDYIADTIFSFLGISSAYANTCNIPNGGYVVPVRYAPPISTDPIDGTPYTPPPNSDTTHNSDGTNAVGFTYMRIGSKSSDNWDGDRTWKENDIPGDKDFRIKLKKKNGAWPSEKACVQIWFSHNKYFSRSNGEDYKVGPVECDRFDVDDDVESIYVEDVDLPSMEGGKNYYFFAVIKDEDGNLLDVSTRTDEEEYVKIDVLPMEYNISVTSASHNASPTVEVGQEVQVTATLKNHLDTTEVSVEMIVWLAGNQQSNSLGTMAANSTKTRTFTFTAPSIPGTYEIVILADPNGAIHETIGTDNRKTLSLTVIPEPVPFNGHPSHPFHSGNLPPPPEYFEDEYGMIDETKLIEWFVRTMMEHRLNQQQ